MQNIECSVKILSKQEIFKDYKKNNPNIFLLSAFTILETEELIWQLNYYNPDKDNLVTFTPVKNKRTEEQKLFKESKDIQKLNLKNKKINIDKALDIITKLLNEKYSSEKINKEIITICTIKDKTLWNFMLLTSSLKTINIKLDALTYEIISQELIPLTSLRKN